MQSCLPWWHYGLPKLQQCVTNLLTNWSYNAWLGNQGWSYITDINDEQCQRFIWGLCCGYPMKIPTCTSKSKVSHQYLQVLLCIIRKDVYVPWNAEMPTISIYFQGGLVWESGSFLSNVYNSMGVASPKIREALKFVQRFTKKSYNFQGASLRIREAWHLWKWHEPRWRKI